MIRLDGFYLYSVGYSIHPLMDIEAGAAFPDSLMPLFVAESTLEGLLTQSVYRLKTCRATGQNLLSLLNGLTQNADRTEPLSHYEAYQIKTALSAFEHVLAAELGLLEIFLVSKKRGYDTYDLINDGSVLFPPELAVKVPEAIEDIKQGTRCIAFELPTAAGFHLHRANESTLHRYYDAATNGATRPHGRNMGDYLAELNRLGVGDAKVKSSLKDLKDLHRNPLVHPEQSLDDVDEAIALLGGIHSAMVHMLKGIPDPNP